MAKYTFRFTQHDAELATWFQKKAEKSDVIREGLQLYKHREEGKLITTDGLMSRLETLFQTRSQTFPQEQGIEENDAAELMGIEKEW
jgi:hypothetical protein